MTVELRDRYIDLVAAAVLGTLSPSDERLVPKPTTGRLSRITRGLAAREGAVVAAPLPDRMRDDDGGRHAVAPSGAMTMIGRRRVENLRACITSAIEDGIPGNIIETGVWRGGAVILAKAIVAAYGEARSVYVADSFAGLPAPDTERYPADGFSDLHTRPELAIGVADVRAGFERFGLLDDDVVFLEGWFRDTLPTVSDVPWAVVRLDGDLYESTMDGLVNLYPQLSPGGFLIIDDYAAYEACAQAVHDFRNEHSITETIIDIDGVGSFWRKNR